MKFKVGQRVKIIGGKHWVGISRKYIGKIATIQKIHSYAIELTTPSFVNIQQEQYMLVLPNDIQPLNVQLQFNFMNEK